MNVHRHENNTNEIYLDDVVMEEERMEEEFEIRPSLQTKENINGDKGEERINDFFFKLHFQRSGDMIIEIHYVGHFIM